MTYPLFYKLNDELQVVPIEGPEDLAALEWARSFERCKRVVDRTCLDGVGEIVEQPNPCFVVEVTTVFYGCRRGLEDPPRVFETLVFGGPISASATHASWDDAVAGHRRIAGEVQNALRRMGARP